jgi:hypothetical protein
MITEESKNILVSDDSIRCRRLAGSAFWSGLRTAVTGGSMEEFFEE